MRRDRLCAAHYRRRRLHGDVQADVPVMGRAPAVCSVEGCDREGATRTWCRAHYHRWITKGDVLADIPLAPRSVACQVDGCTRPARSRRHCALHADRIRRRGTTDLPERIHPPRIASSGYVTVWADGRYVMQHRQVWEQAHGPLLPGQNIHHKNGDRTDNRLVNLEIWDTTQPAGQRAQDKLDYALEMLRRYAPAAATLLREAGHMPD